MKGVSYGTAKFVVAYCHVAIIANMGTRLLERRRRRLYGDYDYSVDNYLDGYEVVITPDDDDESSEYETYWSNEKEEEDDDDSDPMGWEDDDEGSKVGKSETTTGKTKPSPTQYVIQAKDKTVIEETVQISWKKQSSTRSCVPTAMEYAAIITDNPLTEKEAAYRSQFVQDYTLIRNNGDAENKGVYKQDIETFINYEFECSKIATLISIINAVDEGHHVLATIESNSSDIWSFVEHQITVVGYTYEDKYLIYIDPADGNYKKISYWDLGTPIIEIKSKKKR